MAEIVQQKTSGVARLSQRLSGAKKYVVNHKFITGIALVIVLGAGWYMYRSATSTAGQTRYILGAVQQGAIISKVTASGQISANQALDLKPKATGQLTYVGVTPGQYVKAGTLIAEVDPSDAQKQVRDAQTNLESAKLSLAKLQEPADQLSTTQAQNALLSAQTDLATAYSNSQNDIVSTVLDLPSVSTGLQDIVTGTATNHSSQWNVDFYLNAIKTNNPNAQSYRDDAFNTMSDAKTAFDSLLADYKQINLATADTSTIEKFVKETRDASQLIANAIKSSNSYIQLYEDTIKAQGQTPVATADTELSTLSSYSSKVNGHVTSLLSDINSIASDKQSVTEKTQSLSKLQAGANQIDVQTSQLSITKAQNAVQDAQDNLANYFVRAPFAGTIGAVNAHKYDQAGSTAVATLITTQQLADLSLNEVDAAKIKLGDKATLSFDAIPNLTLTGKVALMNPVGSVSQGVVTYDVKISFDAQDPRIKTGMSVNAAIQTAVHLDALYVPSSAVKTQRGQSYVLVFDPPLEASSSAQGILSATAPSQAAVETGISDDTNTEILSGLTLDQQIVVRSVTGTAAAAAATPAAGGGNRGGGFGGGGAAIRL